METLIKTFSNKAFDLLDSRFPKGICLSCKVAMYDRKNGNTSRYIPQMPNYLDIHLLKTTCASGSNDECVCFICLIGKETRHVETVVGRGLKKETTKIAIDDGLFGAKKIGLVAESMNKRPSQ